MSDIKTYPDGSGNHRAVAVRTYADGFGNWHAVLGEPPADLGIFPSREQRRLAADAIQRELKLRDAVGAGFQVSVKLSHATDEHTDFVECAP